jgi:hypothetical protein
MLGRYWFFERIVNGEARVSERYVFLLANEANFNVGARAISAARIAA